MSEISQVLSKSQLWWSSTLYVHVKSGSVIHQDAKKKLPRQFFDSQEAKNDELGRPPRRSPKTGSPRTWILDDFWSFFAMMFGLFFYTFPSGVSSFFNMQPPALLLSAFFLLYAARTMCESTKKIKNMQRNSEICKWRAYPRTQTSNIDKLSATCRMQSFAPKRPPTKGGPAVLAPLGALGFTSGDYSGTCV